MSRSVAAVVLAAGKGTRMNSDTPKVLHSVAGRPMIGHVLAVLAELDVERRIVVVAPGQDAVAAAVAPAPAVIQRQPLGTGDALRAASGELAGFAGTVLAVFGDTPLLTVATLSRMVEAMRRPDRPHGVVLGFPCDQPGRYGRLIENDAGEIERIVEFGEAVSGARPVRLYNGGVMALDGARLPAMLAALDNDNARGEYFLTDLVAIARGQGGRFTVVETVEAETMGVDSRSALAAAEAVMQQRLRAARMADGATLVAPETVFLSYDTVIGRDAVIHPNVTIGPGVRIGERVEVRSFCHLEQARIADDAVIGPYARLRPGAEIGENARIGNFVEVKASAIGKGAKVSHLAYIGDASVGDGSNIGAGVITCNYDGVDKHRTDIGADVFVGSNTAFVAPVRIGDGALIGAGSTVTRSVEPDALYVARGAAREVRGGARRFRASRRRDEGEG